MIGYLRKERVGEASSSPSDVELEPEFIAQPDVFVVSTAEHRRLMAEKLPIRELMVAVEVLSPRAADTIAIVSDRCINATFQSIGSSTSTWHPSAATKAFALDLPRYFESVFATD